MINTSKRDSIMYTIKYGKYYNPASNHYGSSSANCVCDNCGKQHLKICIGWNECDVCLSCTDKINNSLCPDNQNSKNDHVMCIISS